MINDMTALAGWWNFLPRGVFVKDIYPGSGGSSAANLMNVNGTLYFTAFTTATGIEPWESNGTAAGTNMVQDIYAGAPSSSPTNMVTNGSTLFFTATDSLHPWSDRQAGRGELAN